MSKPDKDTEMPETPRTDHVWLTNWESSFDLEAAMHKLSCKLEIELQSAKQRAELAESELQKLKGELQRVEGERDSARKFAAEMFRLSDWPEGGDIDGFDFQQAAAKAGLLTLEQRNEPCGESCFCADYHGTEEMRDGVACYRKVAWLRDAALSSPETSEQEGR